MRSLANKLIANNASKRTYGYSDFAKGITGVVDTVRTAGKTYGFSTSNTIWYGTINGSSAYLKATSDSGSGSASFALIQVSIDGSQLYSVINNGGVHTLFKDLDDKQRRVCIVFRAGYSNTPYYVSTLTDILTVSGLNPSMSTMTSWVQPGDGNSLVAWSANQVSLPNTSQSGYIPLKTPGGVFNVSGSAVPCIRFKTSATTLTVICPSNSVYLSVDGAYPLKYSTTWGSGDGQVRPYVIPLDGTQHTYNVWQSMAIGANNIFAVGINDVFVDVGTKRRLDQYGDSITAGAGTNNSADVDTMYTAAALDLVGSTYGISGETIQGLETRLTALLASKTVTSSDVCVLALGRNNTGAGMSAAALTSYTNIINAMITKGYGKILVRGIIQTGGGSTGNPLENYTTENNDIANVVTNIGNANVIYVSPASWTGISTVDNTHPNVAGYKTLAEFCIPAYAPLI